MPAEALRYAVKVDLEKDAATLPYLHVRSPSIKVPRPLTTS